MNKKGTGNTIITVVGISILLVFLAVVLIAIFCPECLGPSIAAASERIADPIFRGLRGDKFEKPAIEAPTKVTETYDNILSALRSSGKGPCITTHGSFTEDFKDFKITLSDTPNGIFTRLLNEKGQEVKSFTVVGKKPCVVGGIPAAENFYDNYLGETPCTTNCPTDHSVANIEFRDGEHIFFDGKNRDMKARNIIFKANDGNVCFFLTDNDILPWNMGCNKRGNTIDTDCIDKLISGEINMDWC